MPEEPGDQQDDSNPTGDRAEPDSTAGELQGPERGVAPRQDPDRMLSRRSPVSVAPIQCRILYLNVCGRARTSAGDTTLTLRLTTDHIECSGDIPGTGGCHDPAGRFGVPARINYVSVHMLSMCEKHK